MARELDGSARIDAVQGSRGLAAQHPPAPLESRHSTFGCDQQPRRSIQTSATFCSLASVIARAVVMVAVVLESRNCCDHSSRNRRGRGRTRCNHGQLCCNTGRGSEGCRALIRSCCGHSCCSDGRRSAGCCAVPNRDLASASAVPTSSANAATAHCNSTQSISRH